MATEPKSEMNLVVWPADFGLASIDVGCLQSMVAVKISAAPVKFVYSTNPGQSPSGVLPVLIHDDQKLTEFQDIADHLRETQLEVVLDRDLTTSQRCDINAYASYLRNRLYPAVLHTLWNDKANINVFTSAWYSSKMWFPWNLMYIESRRTHARKYLESVNKTDGEITRDAIQVLNALSAKLGDNKYFCGDKPCSLDALIFGYLAPLLKLPLPSDRLQIHLSSLPNLARFVESIICIYLPLTEEQIRAQRVESVTWDKRKLQAQKVSEEHKILKEQRKTEADAAGKSSMRDTILFAIGALTLSTLFAVHTGILSMEPEEYSD